MALHLHRNLCTLLLALLVTNSLVYADIREPPSIALPPPDKMPLEYFKQGQSFDLPCTTAGRPTPERTWLHNGKELDLNKMNIIELPDGIRVSFPGPFDEGEYQCVASNQWGKSLSQLFKVQLATIGDFPGEKIITDYVGNEGKHLVIKRQEIKSVPDPTYTWRIVKSVNDEDPRKLVRTKRIVQDLEGNLYFTSLKTFDGFEGLQFYKVDVFNSVVDSSKGGSYSRVIVHPAADPTQTVPPTLIYPPSTSHEQVFLEGQEMRIQCIFSGNPDVDVTWKGPQRGVYEESNTVLYIAEMSKEAEGKYVCTGSNSGGIDTKNIDVKMETLPKFTEDGKPLKQTLSEGDTATFVCQTTPDTNPPAEIRFMINGKVITDAFPGRATEVVRIPNGLKMTITGLLRDEDIKVVQCRAANKHKTIYIDAPLNVLLRTSLTEKPADQIVEPNTTNIVFKCMATSDPSTDISTTWTRDGKALTYYEDKLMVVDPSNAGLLTLHLSTLKDSKKAAYRGEYECTASNGYTSASHIATLSWSQGGNTGEIRTAAFPIWIILVIIAGILLLLILILIICICIQRNKGDTYPVDAKERKQGLDIEADIEQDAFKDFIRRDPEDEKSRNRSKASLIEPDPMIMGSVDSLEQYGDYGEGKFTEDGSFIGEYATNDRKKLTVPSSTTSSQA